MPKHPQNLAKLESSFPAELLEKARVIAESYHIIVRKGSEGGFVGNCAELRVSVHRPTADECFERTHEAIVVTVASILEDGDEPPAAMELHRRTEQVNVRFSFEEKEQLQRASKEQGGESLSDFIRRAALAAIVDSRSMASSP